MKINNVCLFMIALAIIGAMLLAPTPTVMAGDIGPTPTPTTVPDPGLDWEWTNDAGISQEWWNSSPREWYENPDWSYDRSQNCDNQQLEEIGETTCSYSLIYRDEKGEWYVHTTILIISRRGTYTRPLPYEENIVYTYEISETLVEVLHLLVKYSEETSARILWDRRGKYSPETSISRYWEIDDLGERHGNVFVELKDENYRKISLDIGRFGGGGFEDPRPYRGWDAWGVMIHLESPWGFRRGDIYLYLESLIRGMIPLLPETYLSVPLGNTFIR